LKLSLNGDTLKIAYSERMDVVLDSITRLIKSEIKRQYRSVRQFSEKSGIPYSTLSNALSKGIGGTSYDTVIKICQMLNLKQAYDADLTIFNDQFYEICAMLAALDERGVHTVKTILSVEYSRCTNSSSAPVVKAYNGLTVAGGSLGIETTVEGEDAAND
jgi:predicted transcriptional regulator